MAEIVTGAWTPIGEEGFEYYWDPQGDKDEDGRPAFYWQKPGTDLRARSFVDRSDCYIESLAYILQRRTWDLEMSYRGRTADYL